MTNASENQSVDESILSFCGGERSSAAYVGKVHDDCHHVLCEPSRALFILELRAALAWVLCRDTGVVASAFNFLKQDVSFKPCVEISTHIRGLEAHTEVQPSPSKKRNTRARKWQQPCTTGNLGSKPISHKSFSPPFMLRVPMPVTCRTHPVLLKAAYSASPRPVRQIGALRADVKSVMLSARNRKALPSRTSRQGPPTGGQGTHHHEKKQGRWPYKKECTGKKIYMMTTSISAMTDIAERLGYTNNLVGGMNRHSVKETCVIMDLSEYTLSYKTKAEDRVPSSSTKRLATYLTYPLPLERTYEIMTTRGYPNQHGDGI